MKIIDGFKFGIGYILGQAIVVALAEGVMKVCEKGLETIEKEENE